MKISNNLLPLIVLFSVFSLNAFSQISFDSIVKNSDDIVVLSKNNIVFTGKIRGICRMWDITCENGKADIFMSSLKTIYIEGYYLNGKEEGLWIYKTIEGKLRGKMNFRNGLPHGKYIIYYQNGKKFKKGKYKNGSLEGVNRWWEADGKRSAKEIFKNGREIKRIEYPYNSPIISY
jgi:antitoxin component YwqK of YwqJK toxin-antitoxin module